MKNLPFNLLILIFLAMLLTMSGILLWSMAHQERLFTRLRAVRPGAEPRARDQSGNFVLRLTTAIGNAISRSGLLSGRTRAELEQTLARAGFRRGHGLELFVGAKILLLVMMPLLGFVLSARLGLAAVSRDILLALAALVGLLAPDFALRTLRKGHLKALERGLPDALDLMVICTEAGLGLESTIVRVATEIRHAHAAVADEFAQTASELRITSDIRGALLNAGTRTGLDGIKRLATTLVQTIQYGTPLSQALRTLAAEMRQEMLTRFEARAARLPVLLTVPMIVFILPCVFLVVGGPAMVQVMRMMSH